MWHDKNVSTPVSTNPPISRIQSQKSPPKPLVIQNQEKVEKFPEIKEVQPIKKEEPKELVQTQSIEEKAPEKIEEVTTTPLPNPPVSLTPTPSPPSEEPKPKNAEISQTQSTTLQTHPRSPFKEHISGVGIVQASSENIYIGTPIHRIVSQVFVKVGSEIKKGDVLFQLEDYDLQADLLTRKVEYEIAVAKLNKLKSYPRPEEVAVAEAAFKSAQVSLAQSKSQYEMVQGLQDTRAISRDEVNRRLFNYQQAEAKLQEAEAQLNKTKKGTWQPDIDIAYLESLQAKANIERAKADLDKTIIKSPIDGKVLQMNIHEGEITSVDTCSKPIMIVGNTDELFLQVSINQFDAPYYRPKAPAVAFLRGDSRLEFPLEFVRLEPFLVSKQNLTNDINERVDTRVLHVIYRFKQTNANIFVGQQMDVFIEAEPEDTQ